jgi:inorganic pyrophosphatase
VLDRRISNAGSIRDIRERDPQQIFKTGGIQKFSMLGSQNAISYVPIAFPTKKESGTQTDAGTGTDKPILPGKSKETGTGTGTEPVEPVAPVEPAAPEKEPVKKPEISPPYLLPSQQSIMETWNEYLKERYGEKEALPYVDKVVEESQEYTALSLTYKYLLNELRKAQRTTNKTSEWIRNTGLTLAHFATEGVTELIKTQTKDGVAKWIIDKLKDQLNRTIGGQYTDVEGAIKKSIDAIFVGYERWKGKLVTTVENQEGEPEARNKLQEVGRKVIELYKKYKNKEISLGEWKNADAREEYDILYEKYIKTYGKPPYFDADPLKWGEDSNEDGMLMGGKKKDTPAPEPKKRKVRKSVAIKI